MYPRVPWELVVDPLGSAEHTLGTTDIDGSKDGWMYTRTDRQADRQRQNDYRQTEGDRQIVRETDRQIEK
jgi:hypothetical protein